MSVLLSLMLSLACRKPDNIPVTEAELIHTADVEKGVAERNDDLQHLIRQFSEGRVLQDDELDMSPSSLIGFTGSSVSSSYNGRFTKFLSSAFMEDGKLSRLIVAIDMSSVESEKTTLTKQLKGADFFDVEKFAMATFETTKIENDQITGILEIHGVQKEISFPAEIEVSEGTIALKTKFSIDRRLWGLTFQGNPDDAIKDLVEINLDVLYEDC